MNSRCDGWAVGLDVAIKGGWAFELAAVAWIAAHHCDAIVHEPKGGFGGLAGGIVYFQLVVGRKIVENSVTVRLKSTFKSDQARWRHGDTVPMN